MKEWKLWKAITFDPELGLDQGDSHWKALDEQKTMVPSRRGIEMIEKKINFNTPSLKRYLGGWVCYKVVSEQATTLGLDGPEISQRIGIIRQR